MENWDQEIHRIVEIHQLLQDRQRYFSGHLSTSCYKLDRNGNPLYFPKLHTANKSSREPSMGHSVEANFGSTDTADNTPPVISILREAGKIDPDSGTPSDSSDGNRADYSQNESSDTSGDVNGKAKEVRKQKVMRKSPKVLRKWANKNINVASAPSLHKKSNASTIDKDNIDSRKSSILRFKSVSFDEEPIESRTELLNEVEGDNFGDFLSSTRIAKKNKVPNPINLLRRKSWILKAEMTSRLNDDANDLNLNNIIINNRTKSSISRAREKLKKAERSLRATVKNEHKIPSFRKQVASTTTESKTTTSSIVPKDKQIKNRPVASRLALLQQQEALRSDINLREAFALIKIDPDPLLELASVEKDSRASHGRKIAISGETGAKSYRDRGVAIDDTKKATQSLQRLTKLSIQHLQRQQSLLPNTIIQPLLTPKDKKELESKMKRISSKSSKSHGSKHLDFAKSSDIISRRRSSTTNSTSSGQQKMQASHNTRLKNCRSERERAPKVSLPGKAAAARVERQNSKLGEQGDLKQYSLDRLVGTVV